MDALEKGRKAAPYRGAAGKKDLAKPSFFATMKENFAATEASVLAQSCCSDRVFGASFWSFLAKHSWG